MEIHGSGMVHIFFLLSFPLLSLTVHWDHLETVKKTQVFRLLSPEIELNWLGYRWRYFLKNYLGFSDILIHICSTH